jgi:hypothetical protein
LREGERYIQGQKQQQTASRLSDHGFSVAGVALPGN